MDGGTLGTMPNRKRGHLPATALEFFRAQGRRGGLIGGKMRVEMMTADERRALARKAALARWGTKPKTK